ncbi:MAG: hypothetical protein V7K17_16610 [Nostoc sp.]
MTLFMPPEVPITDLCLANERLILRPQAEEKFYDFCTDVSNSN